MLLVYKFTGIKIQLPPVHLFHQKGTDQKSSSIETMRAMDTYTKQEKRIIILE